MKRRRLILFMLLLVSVLFGFLENNMLAETLKSFSSDLDISESFISKKLLEGQIESYQILNVSDSIFSVVFSPDGTQLASGSADDLVRLWDIRTGKVLQTLKGHVGYVRSVAFSPDGMQLATGSDDKTILVWDVTGGKVVKHLEGHSHYVLSVAFSPDGTQLVSGSADTTVRLWDINTGKVLQTLKGHEGHVRSVTFSPDGMQLATGSNDKTILIWEVRTGKVVKILEGHNYYVKSVSFSPDGMQLATSSNDRTIWFWDVATGKVLKTLKGHALPVNSVSFSPGGLHLASGSHDFEIRLWDVSTGEVLNILRGHEGFITAIAFSPDGTQLASSSNDHTIRLWKLTKSLDRFVIDGETIDWSEGEPIGPPYPEAKFGAVEDYRVIGVTVHNHKGNGAVYQLQGKTHSKRSGLNQLPVYFGKIEPKQSKTRYLPIPHAEIVQGGTADVKITWEELNDNLPPDLLTEIDLDDFPRPNLVTSLRVVDDNFGNGDGVLQPGEAIDLIVSVKNSGDIPAEGVDIQFTLPEDPSLQPFGEQHPWLGSIQAGEIKDAHLTVQVKRKTSLEEIPIRIDIREASFQISKVIEEKLSFAKLERPITAFAVSHTMYVRAERAELLSGANPRASILSQETLGTALQVSGRSGDFYRVELEDGNQAWIPLALVTSSPVSTVSTDRDPPPIGPFPGPAIFISHPSDRFTTESEQITFVGQVQAIGNSSLTQVYVLVNGAAQVSKKFDADKKADIRGRLSLRPGENIIDVEAKDNRGLKSRERRLVRREENTSQFAAVVIGIEKYPHIRPLNYARDDAEAMFAYLTEKLGVPQHRARHLYDEAATVTAIRDTLGVWLSNIAGSNDTVIIYFSGHGAVEEDPSSLDGDSLSKYLLPVGAKAESLYSTAIPMPEVSRMFARIRAKRLIFIVDACYSGGTGGRTIPRPGGSHKTDLALSTQFLDKLAQGEGRWILTASGPNELAHEDENLKHGIFTYHLLQGLNEQSNKVDTDQDGYVMLDELYQYVSREVAAATGQKQRPMLKSEQVGTIPLGHYVKNLAE